MAIEIFNRYENKYKISHSVFTQLQSQLFIYMKLDDYNTLYDTYPICNLYYDTRDSTLIRTSLQKPKYKEKLRLRSYGIPSKESKVFVEIKKKYKGLVNKRRSAMKPLEAYAFLSTGEIPDLETYMNGQVLREIQYMLTCRNLNPSTYISYERRAFFGLDDSDLRISFDTNIVTRQYDLQLEFGIYGTPLLKEGEWLMEIKTSKAIPVWLTKLLSEYQVYPQSFSKYGTAYKSTLTAKKPFVKTPFQPDSQFDQELVCWSHPNMINA